MKVNMFCGVLVTILLAFLLFGCDSLPDTLTDLIDDDSLTDLIDDALSYTITFNTDDGTAIVDVILAEGAVIPKPPDPTKALHNFDGWYKDADLTEPWDFDTDTITGSITLYAKWARTSYQVTFNPNGGTGSMASVQFNSGTDGIKLPTNDEDITRDGYHFISWNTEPDRSGEEHMQGSYIDLSDSDVTLYAQWYVDYSVGDIGPAGGRIFYKKQLPIFSYPEWMYLEAAPEAHEESYTWGSYLTPVPGTLDTVGSGQNNTILIVNEITPSPDTNFAAHYCDSLQITHNSVVYDDWFLPSLRELGAMHEALHRNNIGGFKDLSTYWSSSQYNANSHYANIIHFNQANSWFPQHRYRYSTYLIRPIRAF